MVDSEKPLVVGLDGHANNLLISNKTILCPGSISYKEVILADEDANNRADARICAWLDDSGIDCVFSSSLAPIGDLIKTCKAVLFHALVAENGILKFLNENKKLIIYLLSDVDLSKFEPVDNEHKSVVRIDESLLGVDIGDIRLRPSDILVGKTTGMLELVDFLNTKFT